MPDLKISQLPVASATTGAELFPVVQGGVTKQIALNAVRHIGSAVFDASGNLGLGVTPSAWATANGQRALQITSLASLWTGANGAASLGFNAYESGVNAYTYSTTNPSSLYAQSSGEHRWYTAPSGTAGNAISFTQAMTLNASGNLGVGTASPTSRVHIGNGTGLQQTYIDGGGYDLLLGASGGGFMGYASTTISLMFNTASVPLGIGTNAAQPVLFGTNNFERARITAGGNVGVNCAGVNAKLEVVATTGEVFRADAASGSARIIADQTGAVLGGNIALGVSLSFGGGDRVVAIREAATVPTTNPVGNGILYVESGALKYRGTSGTVTTIANA